MKTTSLPTQLVPAIRGTRALYGSGAHRSVLSVVAWAVLEEVDLTPDYGIDPHGTPVEYRDRSVQGMVLVGDRVVPAEEARANFRTYLESHEDEQFVADGLEDQ